MYDGSRTSPSAPRTRGKHREHGESLSAGGLHVVRCRPAARRFQVVPVRTHHPAFYLAAAPGVRAGAHQGCGARHLTPSPRRCATSCTSPTASPTVSNATKRCWPRSTTTARYQVIHCLFPKKVTDAVLDALSDHTKAGTVTGFDPKRPCRKRQRARSLRTYSMHNDWCYTVELYLMSRGFNRMRGGGRAA